MSNFINGRRGPNVSQYLANLNTIPSAQENAAQEFNFTDESLDLFTNTEFFDFEHANIPGFEQGVGFSPSQQQGQRPQGAKPAMNGPNFQFSEFQTFPQPIGSDSPSTLPPTPPNGLQGAYPAQPMNFSSPQPGDKRKASGVPSAADLEEASRMAAEEDKRRRNTAASARFRVKKKQREQALEKQTRDMADKVQALEAKVGQLEMENKWLKGLITEKADGKGVEAAYKEFAQKMREADERSTESRKDGVGTEDAKEIENSG